MDAGKPDAGKPDAGKPDAGTPSFDAGFTNVPIASWCQANAWAQCDRDVRCLELSPANLAECIAKKSEFCDQPAYTRAVAEDRLQYQVSHGSGSDGKSINSGTAQKIFKAMSKDELAAKANADRNVALQFAAVSGSTPVKCGSQLTGMGSTGVAADVKDLRFYITNLALVNDQGVAVPVKLNANNWQLTSGTETVSLIDLEDATGTCATANNTTATNAVITGTVPAGNYVGLKASMGVPETLNHSAITGGLPPLDSAAMAWS